ncbi:hypothetical protein [Pseudotamlana carrageenivorans]|uniref:Lipoprotein n=1 Tax=Pseudotamlana carrageenivorans TaxID=2069432 RepID=A0A2I7SIF0_9FLAO|nr:hypothetical protein [Tamlana carrageenivorans]AUS05681.1 hypothetical protein C1A40_09490 [Tamlana carrageenivorans]
MKRIGLLILIVLVLFSCENRRTNKEINVYDDKDNALEKVDLTLSRVRENEVFNKTFFLVTKTDSLDILYHYCDAEINTIKVFKDSVWENFGQEEYTMIVKDVVSSDKRIIVKGRERHQKANENYVFKLINRNKGYWSINDKIYIDSLNVGQISEVWQPYKDCWEDEMVYVAELIISKNPTNPIPYLNLGDYYWQSQDVVKSRESYRNYINYMKLIGKENKIEKKAFLRLE